MTRLAVVADIHADDYGSRVDPATGLNARWVDTIAMLRWVAEDARTRRAEVLVIAGDLTEQRHPAPWRVAQIREAIAAFKGPVVLARGNHDGERAGRSIVDALSRDEWDGFTRPGVTQVAGAGIAVLPYLDAHRLRAIPDYADVAPADAFRILGEAFLDIARGLYVVASQVPGPTVLVVHQGLSGGLMSDSQAAFLGDQSLVVDARALAAIGFDAIVAGHFHKHQVLSTDPLIAYAGSPYRTDFGEEHQAKGYLIVDVDSGEASMEFVETPARPFVTLRDPIGDPELVADHIADAVVRVLDLPPEADAAQIRSMLERLGAFEVQEIRRRPVASPDAAAGGLTEGLSAHEALSAYFADDQDAAALIERGRGILEAVA